MGSALENKVLAAKIARLIHLESVTSRQPNARREECRHLLGMGEGTMQIPQSSKDAVVVEIEALRRYVSAKTGKPWEPTAPRSSHWFSAEQLARAKTEDAHVTQMIALETRAMELRFKKKEKDLKAEIAALEAELADE